MLTESSTHTLNLFDDMKSKVGELNKALDSGAISQEGFRAALERLGEEFHKSVAAKAHEAFTEAATPLEKMKVKIEKLQQLMKLGAISQETYVRNLGKVAMDPEAILKSVEDKHPAAVQFGTQEAFKLIAEHQERGARGNDPVKRLKGAIDLQTAIQKAQLDQARRIEEAIKQGKIKVADLKCWATAWRGPAAEVSSGAGLCFRQPQRGQGGIQ
jgi:hypothetical protein